MGLHRSVLVTLQCSPREALTLHFLSFQKKIKIHNPNPKYDPKKHVRCQVLPSESAPNRRLWVDLNSLGEPFCNPTRKRTLCLLSLRTWVYHISYHLQASGKVERYNGLLKTMLRALGAGVWKHWDINLPEAIWLVNNRGADSSNPNPDTKKCQG